MELLTQIINGKNYVLIEHAHYSGMDYDKFNSAINGLDIIVQSKYTRNNNTVYKLLIPETNIKTFKATDLDIVYTEEQEKAMAQLRLMALIPVILFAIFWFWLTNFRH